jgi:hypothetical protein
MKSGPDRTPKTQTKREETTVSKVIIRLFKGVRKEVGSRERVHRYIKQKS